MARGAQKNKVKPFKRDANAKAAFGNPLVEQKPTELEQFFNGNNTRNNENLFSAVRKGDIEKVSQYLKNGADANARLEDGRTLLMVAADRGDISCYIEMVSFLIKNGADVNAADHGGKTALMYASPNGPQIASVLIKNGANVNARDNWGCTPLMHAVMDGGNEIAKMLIENGADINAVDKTGMTAFTYALKFHRRNMMKLLLDCPDFEC